MACNKIIEAAGNKPDGFSELLPTSPPLSRQAENNMKMLILLVSVLLIVGCGKRTEILTAERVKVDRVLVKKEERKLILMTNGRELKTYRVALGSDPVGPKEKEGDGKTPEGEYIIDRHNAKSSFHRSLHISYPAAADLARARREGVRPGGDIMIHGIGNGLGWIGSFHHLVDWTRGCIAVTNTEIEEIFALVRDGTPIELRP